MAAIASWRSSSPGGAVHGGDITQAHIAAVGHRDHQILDIAAAGQGALGHQHAQVEQIIAVAKACRHMAADVAAQGVGNAANRQAHHGHRDRRGGSLCAAPAKL